MLWKGYDWVTDNLDGANYLNEINVQSRDLVTRTVIYIPNGNENNMADCRLYRCTLGEDGSFVATGHCAGGNNLFRYHPQNNT
jgi:hypothetical protein